MPPVTTRRELLSAMSLIFDPLGICLPIVTGAKLLFQQTHKLEMQSAAIPGWDWPLPSKLLAQWLTWANGLDRLSHIRVKRCLRPHDFPLLVRCLRSSSVAYGAVAYLRVRCEGRVHVAFVMAKGRLAHLKPTTVPRLELEAALLAVNLSLIIRKELRINIATVEFYTDSQVVLHQLRYQHRTGPTFITTRTAEILTHSTLA